MYEVQSGLNLQVLGSLSLIIIIHIINALNIFVKQGGLKIKPDFKSSPECMTDIAVHYP